MKKSAVIASIIIILICVLCVFVGYIMGFFSEQSPDFNEDTGDTTVHSTGTYLSFRPNGGIGGCSIFFFDEKENSYEIVDDIVCREGYIFQSWNTKPDGTGKAFYTGDVITSLEDIEVQCEQGILYAIWEKDTGKTPGTAAGEIQRLTYTSNFGGMGGCVQYISKENVESYTILEPMVARAGYTFLYWNTKADGSGNTFRPGDKINSMIQVDVLYAIWGKRDTLEPDLSAATIDWDVWLQYSANGGEGGQTEHLSGGASFAIAATSVYREGYIFQSWNTEPNGTGRTFYPGDIFFSTAELGSSTLYAMWEEE